MAAKKKTDEQVVRVAPLGELRAYTIWEHELEHLEQGAPVSDLLTIGLCLLSAALTVLITLLSTSLSVTALTLFFCGLLITGLIGAICTYLGWRGRISTKELGRQIRSRLPAAPLLHQGAPNSVTGPPPLQTLLPPLLPAPESGLIPPQAPPSPPTNP